MPLLPLRVGQVFEDEELGSRFVVLGLSEQTRGENEGEFFYRYCPAGQTAAVTDTIEYTQVDIMENNVDGWVKWLEEDKVCRAPARKKNSGKRSK